MDLAIDLGLTSTLHIHASGALTFCAPGEEPAGWDDDIALLTIAA
jgi:hypothetical protein